MTKQQLHQRQDVLIWNGPGNYCRVVDDLGVLHIVPISWPAIWAVGSALATFWLASIPAFVYVVRI